MTERKETMLCRWCNAPMVVAYRSEIKGESLCSICSEQKKKTDKDLKAQDAPFRMPRPDHDVHPSGQQ